MPRGPKGEKRPADVIGAAVMEIQTETPPSCAIALGRAIVFPSDQEPFERVGELLSGA